MTIMRTTIEVKDEHRARLLELAARRGRKGFSSVVEEALECYLAQYAAREEARKRALQLRGCLSTRDAEQLRKSVSALRETWR